MNTLTQNTKKTNKKKQKKHRSVNFSRTDELVLAKQASTETFIRLKISRYGLDDNKGPENINCTMVKHMETFYGKHTALTPAVVKINGF